MIKKLAVIGYPIAHSLSPVMHNFISKAYDAPYTYEAIEVMPERLGEAVLKLRQYCGFNVTAPHKVEIMKFLDEISPDAKRYGAVNTVVNENGRLIGYNTDAEGFYMSLKYKGVECRNAHILMLGAGGAASSVAMMLARRGAASLTLVNRTHEKAEKISRSVFADSGFKMENDILRESYDIVINCTSLGMGKNIGLSPLSDMSVIGNDSCSVDMIYNPPETVFLREAKARGARCINGLPMLIFQGILAYRLFTGLDVPFSIAEDIEKEVLYK